jgi:predicted DNA-binding WGR domain protein
MRRFTYVEGTSSKFWEADAAGAELTVRFGRLGTNGTTQVKTFDTAAKAADALAKLIREKVGKGYVEDPAGAAARPAASAPTAPAPAATAPTATAAPASAAPAPSTPGPSASPSASPPPLVVVSSKPPPPPPAPAPVGGIVVTTKRPPPPAARPAPTPYVSDDDDAVIPPAAWSAAHRAAAIGHPAIAHPVKLKPVAELVAALRPLQEPGRFHRDHSWRAEQTGPRDLRQRAFERLSYGDLTVPDEPIIDWMVAEAALVHAPNTPLAAWVVGVGGLTHAITGLAEYTRLWPERPSFLGNDALNLLRACVSAAPAEEREAIREFLRARSRLGVLAHDLLEGALFPDAPEVAEAWIRSQPIPPAEIFAHHRVLIASVTDPALLAEGAAKWWPYKAADGLLLGAAATAGAAATSLFDAALRAVAAQRQDSSVRDAALRCAVVLGPAHHLRLLLGHLDDLHVARALPAVCDASPAPALRVLHAAVADAPTDVRLRMFLRNHLAAHPEVHDAAMALGAPAADLLAGLRGPAALLPADAVPDALRRPPWTRPAPTPLPVIERAPLPWTDTLQLTADDDSEEQPEPITPPTDGDTNYRWAWFEQYRAKLAHPEPSSQFDRNRGVYLEYLWQLDRPAVLRLWNELPAEWWNMGWETRPAYFRAWRDEVGVAGLPGFLRQLERATSKLLPILLPFSATPVALPMARALGKNSFRADAVRWLHRHPDAAIAGLLHVAVGPHGADREAAEAALRLLAAAGHRDAIRQAGADTLAAVDAVLDRDLLSAARTKPPALPAWAAPTLHPRPTDTAGRGLDDDATTTLIQLLALSTPATPHPGVAAVRGAFTPTSLADLAWSLYEAWAFNGFDGKQSWALGAVGLLGDDRHVRLLDGPIRAWPFESAYQRAVLGLDVLCAIGTERALMALHAISQKKALKALRGRAEERIQDIATARGLSAEDLADRLVPDLGLDASGRLTLDFGPRQFTVAFDEQLKPFVRDAEGRRLKDLPGATKSDDPALSAEAITTWKDLKKDARALASSLHQRLLDAMRTGRRWSVDDFTTYLVEHPVVRHLAARLVWAAWTDDGPPVLFRLVDGERVDADEAPVDLPPTAQIGVVHPAELPPRALDAFATCLADDGLAQPFPQVTRPVFTLPADEAASPHLTRYVGKSAPPGAFRGLVSRGWVAGPPQDAGAVTWYDRPAGGAKVVRMDLDPGVGVDGDWNPGPVRAEAITAHRSSRGYRPPTMPISDLSPVTLSELIYDLEHLFGS